MIHFVEREKVVAAYERELEKGTDESSALVAAAQALCIPVEAALECVKLEQVA